MKRHDVKTVWLLTALSLSLAWGAGSYAAVDNEDAGNLPAVTEVVPAPQGETAQPAAAPAEMTVAQAATNDKSVAPAKPESAPAAPAPVKAEPAPVAPAKAEPASPAPKTVETAAVMQPAPQVKPDKEGVIKNLPFVGPIEDFLRLLGSGCQKNIMPSSQVKGQIRVELFDVTFHEALEAVLKANGYAYEEQGPFVYVYTQKEFAERQAAARKMETRVFKLNYIPSADMEKLIKPLLSKNAQVTTSPEAVAGVKDAFGGENWAVSNYIIVIDYPEALKEIESMVAEMDRRPPQVLVEATILVAAVTDTDELGVDFNVLGGVNFESVNGFPAVPVGTTPLNTTTTAINTGFTGGVTDGGLSIGLVKSNLGLFIKAIESTRDVVTLGNPKVLTLNRQMGKVIVGNRDGYVTTQVSQTTTTQTVEFLETGTTLSFRPFVMDDGYIRMELNPKDSDGGVTVSGQFTLPAESTAEVTTNVLVKDGCTIVIGGLFRDKSDLTRSQIPLLGELPLVGVLFRNTIDNNEKEEVIFLITPHVVRDNQDYAAGEKAWKDAQRLDLGAREAMQCHSREKLSMAFYNLAKQRQIAGNSESALWNANMARDLNPISIDAQNLRDELLEKHAIQGEAGCMRLFMRQLIENDTK
jgi:type IV pilus assembly protein PilQ